MCIYVCMYKDLSQELAHVVLEIKKSHRLKSQGCNSVQTQWAKNLGGWWDKSKFESESQESKHCVQKHKKIVFSTQAKKNLSSTFLFYSNNWMMATHIGRGWSLIQLFLETSSQTHPEIVTYQLSEHPLVQSSWHVKWTITLGHERNQVSAGTRTRKLRTFENSVCISHLPSPSFQCISFILKFFSITQTYLTEISTVTQENTQDWDWSIFVLITNSQERDYNWLVLSQMTTPRQIGYSYGRESQGRHLATNIYGLWLFSKDKLLSGNPSQSRTSRKTEDHWSENEL